MAVFYPGLVSEFFMKCLCFVKVKVFSGYLIISIKTKKPPQAIPQSANQRSVWRLEAKISPSGVWKKP